MREIKFRGKNFCGSWVYGDLRHDRMCMPDGRLQEYISVCGEPIYPDTVGQFTGLKDSNGKEIYEGDIVKATLKDKSFVKRFHMDGTVTGKISFDGAWWLGEWDALWRLPRYYDLTVIGNVYDNPELLKLTKK